MRTSGIPFGAVDRDEASAPFFDAAATEQLVVRSCPDGHLSPPEAQSCTTCRSSTLDWAPVSGRATLISWIVMPRRVTPEDPEPSSIVAGTVELEEGPWFTTGLLVDPVRLRAGATLDIMFVRPDGSEAFPVFELVEP